ncbi:MAG: large conductance mechanosensitive channel protein MscL [Acutalibacteraceae bacterium]|nr:large conductance mechanosensitive channel protein MscL [Acutalibacteraceae bacterium]
MKKNGFIAEFKKFITRGNVMDLAVGVIIGGAFTAIVTSLNNDIISPLLGIFGGVDFSQYSVALFGTGAVLKYGSFLTAVINFLITSLVIFCLIKGINTITDKFKKHDEEEPAPTTKTCPFCKSEIAIDAVRCPHCTSELEIEADDEAKAEAAAE